MANQLSNFQFQDNAVRVIAVNGEPWFLAADVCRAIGITSPSKAVKILDDDEVALKTFQGLTKGNEEANFISESGMYKIVMRSQDAIKLGTPAHAFTKWVTSEVLPAIRKTGQYQQPELEIDFTRTEMMRKAFGMSRFMLFFDHTGRMQILPVPSHSFVSTYGELAKAIRDPSNIGLSTEHIKEIAQACIDALACRAKSRKAAIGRARSGDNPQS